MSRGLRVRFQGLGLLVVMECQRGFFFDGVSYHAKNRGLNKYKV